MKPPTRIICSILDWSSRFNSSLSVVLDIHIVWRTYRSLAPRAALKSRFWRYPFLHGQWCRASTSDHEPARADAGAAWLPTRADSWLRSAQNMNPGIPGPNRPQMASTLGGSPVAVACSQHESCSPPHSPHPNYNTAAATCCSIQGESFPIHGLKSDLGLIWELIQIDGV